MCIYIYIHNVYIYIHHTWSHTTHICWNSLSLHALLQEQCELDIAKSPGQNTAGLPVHIWHQGNEHRRARWNSNDSNHQLEHVIWIQGNWISIIFPCFIFVNCKIIVYCYTARAALSLGQTQGIWLIPRRAYRTSPYDASWARCPSRRTLGLPGFKHFCWLGHVWSPYFSRVTSPMVKSPIPTT